MDDLISRQAAIDAVYKCTDIYINNLPVMVDKEDAYKALADLPSAQPEIIKCKDCKNGETRTTANYIPFLYCKLNKHSALENAFCCWAERRGDG